MLAYFKKLIDDLNYENIEYSLNFDSCLIHNSLNEIEKRKDIIYYCFTRLNINEQEEILQKNQKNLIEYYLIYHRELQIKKSSDRLIHHFKSLSDIERQTIFKKRDKNGLSLIHYATAKRCTHLLNIFKSFRASKL